MIISCTYGHENFQASNARYGVFACRSNAHNMSAEAETVMWVAGRDRVHGIAESGRGSTVPAAPGKKPELGKWTTARFDVPSGLVLKLFGQRKTAQMVSGRYTQASMLVQIRPSAPLIRVRGRLSGDGRASSDRVVVFEGRADVINVFEAGKEGVVLQPRFLEGFKDHNVRTLFEIEELQPATKAKPALRGREVENTKGKKVIVEEARPSRLVEL